MPLNQWDKVKEIFSDAVELRPAERPAFLDGACEGDSELRASVERLLAQADLTASLAILPPKPRHSLSPGDLMTPRFRIRRFVGAGGMGEVYEAEDLELGGTVALKTLRPAYGEDASFLGRFRREVQLARQVTHANICRIFDVGNDAGRVFLTMEFLDGETLSAYLRHTGRLPAETAGRLMRQLAEGLGALHEKGIVHRDLKPGNVMITQSSGGTRAIIGDFGLARALESSGDATSLSVTGHVMGTPDYMAPEQFRGEPASPASDIYALGLVMYEMVTGKKAFPGGQALENAVQRATEAPSSPRLHATEISPEWEALILRCLERDPAKRPANTNEVLAGLAGHLTPLPLVPLEPVKRNWWPWAAALATAAVVAVFAWRNWRPAPPVAAETVTTRITTDSGLSFDPAISRDGKLVAFASDRAGNGDLDLWVQQVGGGAPIRLTTTKLDESSPDFSPDGTRVVFRSERDGGGIYSVNTFGGEPALLVAGGRHPKFSPDGKSIAFWSGREGTGLVPGSAQVRVIPASGGEARVVAPEFAASLYPVWSPTGDALLCLARKPSDRTGDWYVIYPNGRPPRPTGAVAQLEGKTKLTPATQSLWRPLAWLSQPQRVVFGANAGDSTNLFEARLSDELRLEEKPQALTNGTAFETEFAMAAGGARMVYSSLKLNFDIWGVPVDADRGSAAGPMRRLTKEESSEAQPSLSWDGAQLSYRSRAAAVMSLHVLNLLTGKDQVLVNGPMAVTYPKISGDGRTVTYLDANDAVVQLPAQGGEARLLCKECGWPLDAGRDGQRILVEPAKPPDDVRMLHVATGQVSTLMPARQVLLGARWSPDGEWVAFHEYRKDSAQARIFVAHVGAQPTPPDQWIPITDGTQMDRDPAWSPGGNVLYFLSDRDGFRCLYAQRLDGRTKHPVGPPLEVQHLHEGGRSLRFVGNRSHAIGLTVGRGLAVLTLGELTGNVWQRESAP